MFAKMSEWSAWYSGEPSRIVDAYSSQASQGSLVTPWYRFWTRARAAMDGAQRAMLHVPVASDLAAVSGALLFGEPPTIRVRDARAEATADEVAAEARMIAIAEQGDMYSRLVEAAESAAAIGGVYIYPVWDVDFRDVPLLGVAQADMALPSFKHGFLASVMFHRVVLQEGHAYWRHVESHVVEDGRATVYNGLYLGGVNGLGEPRPLASHPATARLSPKVVLPFSELDVEYVPNIRPNRLWRSSGHGLADIAGSESLLDALDETYASWMRDVRLAKARIIVPNEFLRSDADGNPAFDIDQEIYVGMDMDPTSSQDTAQMLAHQFAIRFEAHRATATNLIERIVSNAGYTPNALGGASAASASSIRVSDHKTLLTLRRKSGWWRTAIANVMYHMALIDRDVFKSGIEPTRPTVLTADSIIDSPFQLAQTVLALKTAESASVETRVRMVHPDWSTGEVLAEVARISGERPSGGAVIASGGTTFGRPEEDPAAMGNKPITSREKVGFGGNTDPKATKVVS